jgi:hypothetical protein
LNFEPADDRAGHDIAGFREGDRNVRESENADRVVTARIAVDAACARDDTDKTEILGGRSRDDASLLEARRHRWRCEENFGGCTEVAFRFGEFRRKRLPHLGGQPKAHAAGDDEATPKTIPRERHEKVQELAAEASKPSSGWKKRNVVRKRAQVANVIGDALELKGNAAERLGGKRQLHPGERFDDVGVRKRVSHRGIASNRLGNGETARGRSRDEQLLGTAMLVAKMDFEVQDVFAGALKAKVARLDDARMNGANGDFVDTVTCDGKKRVPRLIGAEMPTAKRF